MKIWVLVIDHKYGTDTYAFSTEEKAREHLDGYIFEWWDVVDIDPATLTHEERIERYFYDHPDNEWYVLRETNLDGETE
jgi:hypothetical protein